jgi:1-aminocyclopropane-1-carboxylate deaminase/D-cysteine desulfhydrase-like pyridoxal-dependent ACC family enzyme
MATTAIAPRAGTAPLISDDDLRAKIAKLPRIPFAFVPTPLEACPKLSSTLGPRILMKRDDLTGFAFGGNKVRALEFRMADLLAQGCDTLVLTNIGQSNHARLHTAACARLGLHMVHIKPSPADEEMTGNLLLDRIVGSEIVEANGRNVNEVLDETIKRLESEGRKPYAHTRAAFSRLAGTVAYSEASIELRDQLRAAGIGAQERVHIFLVGGTSSAGLALGGKLLGTGWRVHAVSVGGSAESVMKMELDQANRVADLLDFPTRLEEADIDVHDDYVGGRYAAAPTTTLEAIKLAARTDAIFMDPTYVGKAFSGVIGEARKGNIAKDETVVFVHTGGTPIIFAFHELLKDL